MQDQRIFGPIRSHVTSYARKGTLLCCLTLDGQVASGVIFALDVQLEYRRWVDIWVVEYDDSGGGGGCGQQADDILDLT